ncbi:peptidase M23 [Helicobacter sp. 12S02634-8]|uniref:M23 family metallopeptidase n=1 Tax=Helicobacter sp. 12S02634-8 TaxID=1476199 RepID=UPI000BA502B6|nr:M23 family metallopeptidase [Helicobacter sp. 12S02634-8]PAF48185.1 peptidase M23 [Helicobacter sp. 12S02634-8]
MQEKLVVTIVDESGSKQFLLPKSIKKIIIISCVALALVMIASILLMRFLMQKIDTIAFEKNIALSEYKYIHQKNNSLKDQIKQKGQELAIVSQKIEDLENIVDFKKNTDKNTSENPIDLDSLSLPQKNLILSLIPNGEPLKTYTSKTPSAQRSHPLKQVKGIPAGLDFSTPNGAPVFATADGVIDLVRNNPKSGYGNLIKITHSFGFSSLYAHLEKSLVKKGDFVQKGQIIGYSGHSGDSDGDKLYYEVRFLGKVLDPNIYVAWSAQNFQEVFKSDSSIDWESLFWAIGDIIELQGYKLSYQTNTQAQTGITQ